MDVSIIVVNWNGCDLVRQCLTTVYGETKGIRFEVIVVDNQSSDGSVDMLRSEFPQTKVIASEVNLGFAAGNNVGMAAASGRYLLLLNPDTLLKGNAIAQMVTFADAHPKAGVLGPRVLNQDGTLQLSCFMYPSLLNLALSAFWLNKLFARNRFFGREAMSWNTTTKERPVDVVSGCCMLVRREVYEQVGGMDESYFMYFEETDWCYRAGRIGWEITYAPVAEIVHLGGATTEAVKSDMMAQHAASLLLYFRKHKGLVAYRVACVLLALFFLLRMPYWLVSALFSSRRAYARTRLGICARIFLGAICGGGSLHFRRKSPDRSQEAGVMSP